MSDRYMAQEALDKIIDSLDFLPDEVSHHAANILDDEQGTEYCQAIIDALLSAAGKIQMIAGIDEYFTNA